MNLGTAIQRAHERKDTERRNDLLRVALTNGSTYRDLARLLGCSTHTVWSWAGAKKRQDPLAMPVSVFESEKGGSVNV